MSKKGSITTADYLPFEEFQKLVNNLINDEEYMWATYCMLSFCLGLRSSDVRKLKWIDVLNKRNIVITEKKTQKTKGIPIGNTMSERIYEMYEKMDCPHLNDYIFTTERSNGEPMTIQFINRTMKKWKKKYDMSIDHFSTHTLRKTFGRYVFEKRNRSSEALIELNRIFRHQNLQTTMIYIGVTDDKIYDMFNSITL